MKANEFVKKFGLEYVTNVINNWNQENPYLVVSVDNCTTIHIDDLKRLVESYELVQSYGGLEKTKKILNDMHDDDLVEVDESQALYSAIADVEGCQ